MGCGTVRTASGCMWVSFAGDRLSVWAGKLFYGVLCFLEGLCPGHCFSYVYRPIWAILAAESAEQRQPEKTMAAEVCGPLLKMT
jgi:hypothetical protein